MNQSWLPSGVREMMYDEVAILTLWCSAELTRIPLDNLSIMHQTLERRHESL